VVDVEGDVFDQLTKRIVRQFSHMHDRFDPAQVFQAETADVGRQGVRRAGDTWVQPASLVVAGVNADHLMAVFE